MKRLSLADDTFLRLESRQQPQHIGMLMLLEPGKDAPADFAMQIAERLRQSNKAEAPFSLRLERSKGLHYWTEDKEFDLGHHFTHISLPKPGRIRELLAMVSRVHSGHLDRAYPLWRIYLIEGLEDGRFAVYLKIHHSMVDGVSGIKMLLKSMATTPEASLALPPIWETPTKKSRTSALPIPAAANRGLSALLAAARSSISSATPVWREFRTNIRDLKDKNPDVVVAGQAPRCLFNQNVSATRRFAAQSYSTPRIKAVATHYETSLNDVVLAMCGSALRHYLQDLNALPGKPLVAAVPVSMRGKGSKSKSSNEVAFTLTQLATDIDDPEQRLITIKNCMNYNKKQLRELSPGQAMAHATLKLIPGLRSSADSTFMNLVISHIPGPRRDMYWQGAKLSGLYPMSLLNHGGALNITLVSRYDFVDVGLIACRKAVPHVQHLLKYIEDGLCELEACIK
ncbi:wax ester/triacylglycerol synthase family O-acyltransferase [Zhongshania sp.]|uniref:WS/DGAT/MGAT family O-acyltransferase n=1 Tax=Zhongshania sp. TaxID=1971902 RepID=UPI00356A4104